VRLIVIYDISDDGDRERLARRLLALGLERVQRSAFVGVGGAALAKDVARAAQPFARGERDSVIVFVVPASSVRGALVVGRPMAPLEGVARYAVL
jgi:CRISPR-associated endonuclease Cas2